jgi:hypothetical protein
MGNTKKVALATLVGTLAAFGGCLNWQPLLYTTGQPPVIEFVTGNENVLDSFEDGATGAQ